jgi:hypothetical protein
MTITFSSFVKQAPGMKATGIPVPDDVVAQLGGSKKPAVAVTIGDYRYRTTVASMYGGYIFPLSAEHRAAAGLSADDPVEVAIELDLEPRTTEVPDDLAAALDSASVRAAFDALSPSRQKAHVTNVEGTKNQETRARRIASVAEQLGG